MDQHIHMHMHFRMHSLFFVSAVLLDRVDFLSFDRLTGKLTKPIEILLTN